MASSAAAAETNKGRKYDGVKEKTISRGVGIYIQIRIKPELKIALNMPFELLGQIKWSIITRCVNELFTLILSNTTYAVLANSIDQDERALVELFHFDLYYYLQ